MILLFYPLSVAALIALTYQIDETLPFEYRHSALVAAFVMGTLSVCMPLLVRMFLNHGSRAFKATPAMILAMLLFNLIISFPIVFLKLEAGKTRYLTTLEEAGVFVAPWEWNSYRDPAVDNNTHVRPKPAR